MRGGSAGRVAHEKTQENQELEKVVVQVRDEHEQAENEPKVYRYPNSARISATRSVGLFLQQ
jgi:hypothetical protein